MQATTATWSTGRASIPGSVNAAAYCPLASTRRSVTVPPSVMAPSDSVGTDAEVVIPMTVLVTGGSVAVWGGKKSVIASSCEVTHTGGGVRPPGCFFPF